MNQPPTQAYFSDDELIRYLNEHVAEQQESSIQSHIGGCSTCQSKLQRLAGGDDLWKGARELDAPTTNHDSSNPHVDRVLETLGPTDDPQSIGRLGNYEVLGVIGTGSTGVVLKALETRLNRFVAIKVLSPTLSHIGAARQRFEREARAVAAVSHEHVVPIFAVNEFRGLPYIVMQYVPGVSLLQRIDRDGFLDTCEVVRIGLQVSRGLGAAHDQGIVHRDVKPANVLLEETVDRALVTDFGLAQVAHENTMTRSGTISGTPQYMSPEQARGESITARSDLFSLGSLMYAACTARAPFRAETVFGIIHRVCETEPRSILELNPEIAPWLVSFIEKLMAKHPEQRFESADRVASYLEQELAYLQNPTSAPAPSRDWLEIAPVNLVKKPQQPTASTNWTVILAVVGLLVASTWIAFQWRSTLVGWFGGGGVTNTANATGDSPGAGFPALFGATIAPDDDPAVTWTTGEGDPGSLTQSYFQRVEQSFELKPDSPVQLEVDFGDIEIRQTELDYISLVVIREFEAGTQAEAEKLAGMFNIEIDNQRELKIQAFQQPSRNRSLANVRYGLGVPAGLALELTTGKGDIVVDTLAGTLDLETHAGDIRCGHVEGTVFGTSTGGEVVVTEGCSGNVDLMATHGNVCVAGVAGEARLRASQGNIYLGDNSGSISAQVTGGDVRIAAINGKTGAHVSQGSIVVRLDHGPTAEANLSVTRGDIVIDLPSDAQTDLIARSAELTNPDQLEFEVLEDPADDDQLPPSQQVSINGGGQQIKLTALTGTIDVRASREPVQPDDERSLGGSGNPYFSLGGSGNSADRQTTANRATEKTSGDVRPGAMVPIEVADGGNIDGYTLYLPVSHGQDEDKQWPVLVYLQGGYGVGGPITRLNGWGLPRLIRDESDLSTERNRLLLDTFIVVSLHINGGDYYDEPETVQQILDDVIDQQGGDRDRVYVSGLSRGGHGTLGMCSELPATFAAAVPIAGRDHSRVDYRVFDEIPVWLAHNEGDTTIEFDQGTSIVRKIERRARVEFERVSLPLPTDEQLESEDYLFTHPETGRHDAWTEIYCSVQFYRWLLRHSR